MCSPYFLLGRTFPAFAAEDWKREWEKTIDAAKREGEVVIYGPHNPMYRALWDRFERNYSGIKINFVPGKGSEHTHKVLAERRAGKYIADLVMGGSSSYRAFPPGTLEPLRADLILRRLTTTSLPGGKKLCFADPKNNSAIVLTGEVGTRRGSYNTKLLDPKEIQSWWDLLQPKFKGKLGTFDPLIAGGGGETLTFSTRHPRSGRNSSRLLTETDILGKRPLPEDHLRLRAVDAEGDENCRDHVRRNQQHRLRRSFHFADSPGHRSETFSSPSPDHRIAAIGRPRRGVSKAR